MGSAPEGTKYWFEESLVCLVRHLDYPGVLTKAIADAISYGRTSARTSFNAVPVSIEHVVLVKSLPDGSVDHTELLCLIPITTHYSKDARVRYGDEALDAFHDAKFPIKTKEVKVPEDIHVEQLSKGTAASEMTNEEEEGSTESGDLESEDTVKLIVQMSPGAEASIKQSFMGLVQFFEATILETLRPTQPNEARIPEELCQMVLRNVSDTKTYNSCLKVSRSFRLTYQQRPLVMDNVVFLEPLPREPASLLIKEKGEDIRSQRRNPRNKRVQRLQPPPDFLAVEQSSARHMDVSFNSGDKFSFALKCLIVVGCELNRKSFAGHMVSFQGLCVPIPLGVDEAGKRRAVRPAEMNMGSLCFRSCSPHFPDTNKNHFLCTVLKTSQRNAAGVTVSRHPKMTHGNVFSRTIESALIATRSGECSSSHSLNPNLIVHTLFSLRETELRSVFQSRPLGLTSPLQARRILERDDRETGTFHKSA